MPHMREAPGLIRPEKIETLRSQGWSILLEPCVQLPLAHRHHSNRHPASARNIFPGAPLRAPYIPVFLARRGWFFLAGRVRFSSAKRRRKPSWNFNYTARIRTGNCRLREEHDPRVGEERCTQNSILEIADRLKIYLVGEKRSDGLTGLMARPFDFQVGDLAFQIILCQLQHGLMSGILSSA